MTVTTFNQTGAVQTYTVPTGVTFVTIECYGAYGGYSGAYAGYAKARHRCNPGDVLYVYVGGNGTWATNDTVGQPGGWNGGGASRPNTLPTSAHQAGASGGGATDVRTGTSLASRIIVAGGSGGYLSNSAGYGFGGGADGGNPPATTNGLNPPAPPKGGTPVDGYALGQGGPGYNGGGGGYWGGYGSDTAGVDEGAGGSGYVSSEDPNAVMVAAGAVTAGMSGPISARVVITAVNTAPLAPTPLTPPNLGYLVASEDNTLTLHANDTDFGDGVSQVDLRFKKSTDSGFTTTLNVANTQVGSDPFTRAYTLPANTWTVGAQYELQWRTYDTPGAASPWSSSIFYNVIAAIPAPTITIPAADGTVVYSTPLDFEWTLPAGYSQEAFQVQRTQNADGTGTVYYDSGTVVSTGLSASMPIDASTGRTDYLRVRFRYYGHWSPWVTRSILNEFGPPQTPLATCTWDPDAGAVIVEIINLPASGGYADTVSNDVTRTITTYDYDGNVIRIDGPKRVATGVATSGYCTDRPPGTYEGLEVDYRVIAYAANGSTASSA